uniref:DUF5131 family protein n=1 Tax=Nonomuraea sp. CA-251285 TaxID=3240002 RepID=UPI003F4973CE
MGIKTSIGWTDRTHNPLTHRCTPIGDECDGCYAHVDTKRWQGPLAFTSSPPTIVPDRLLDPLLTGSYRVGGRMFGVSMSDPFHPGLAMRDQALMWAVWAAIPHWEIQLLTKRAALMCRRLSSDDFPQLVLDAFPRLVAMIEAKGRLTPNRRRGIEQVERAAARFIYPVPNIVVGVSAGRQFSIDRRLPRLAATPGVAKMVSIEPMVDERPVLGTHVHNLDWVIIGGESGRRARPFDLDGARALVAECRQAEVPVFVKQLGSRWASATLVDGQTVRSLKDSKGENPDYWPADLRIQEFPQLAVAT